VFSVIQSFALAHLKPEIGRDFAHAKAVAGDVAG